ncbi:MAG: DUF5329 domain-containing protein [Bacteroidia bacterium]|nr:DUF5329 domain-containing protein [Bacteroidia bacterium]
MRLKLFLIAIFLWCFIPSKANLFGSISYQQQPKKITETQKIESLIAFIAKQDGVFIRNGSEYTPGQAAEHLRMKWKKGGSAIKTAEIFIDKLATSSSMSGKPYQIKFKNGRSINLAALLRAELKRLEQ